MSKLKKETLENEIPDWEHQNVYLYQACVLSTLLCGSELGPPKWDRTPLELFPFAMPQAHPRRQVARPYHQQWDIPSMPSLCSQRRLRWLGHVHRMDDGRIPKKVLFGQLKTGVRKAGRPALRFMEANKRDLKTCEIDPSNRDDAASERARRRRTVKKGIENAGVKPCFTICFRILLSRGVA